MADPIILKKFTAETVLLGTDANGNTPGLKVNSSNQLQVEVITGGTNKILGTAAPLAATNTNLYTVPASTTSLVSKFWAVNRGAATVAIRVGFDVGGSGTNTPGDAEWLYYDLLLLPNQTLTLDGDLWLATTDDLVVYSDLATTSFGATGREFV